MRLQIVAAACASFLAVSAPARAEQTVAGLWEQVDDKSGRVLSHVSIFERGGVYYGRIAKYFPGPGEEKDPVCDKCQGALRGKPILGLVFLSGLKRNQHVYEGGSLLDPETGAVYQGTVTLSPDGNHLSLRGYVLTPTLGRSQTWRRLR